MPKITRRTTIFSSLALAGAGLPACQSESVDFPVSFQHGVASGDPTQCSVIIWTRISAETIATIPGKWQVSDTPDFKRISKKGKFSTGLEKDYTVKIDVDGLNPGQTYYYRFKVGNYVSRAGRTKTLAEGRIDNARFALVSCTNYPFGHFNVYDHISKNPDFDAVIHLGDYFYEYGRDGYGGETGTQIGREHEPAHETISLSDYRIRHAQYKGDPSSIAMLAAHPLICVWDDHETANDSWTNGAENHDPLTEGSWEDRRASAMKAYYEWMPVRDPNPGNSKEALFKTYRFGDLLTLTSIETRLTARSQPLVYADFIPDFTSPENVGNFVKNVLGDPGRELIGEAQKQYIAGSLQKSKSSGEPWRVIANQTIMARVHSPDLSDYAGKPMLHEVAKTFPPIYDYVKFSPLGLPLNLDSWDGYPAARERFYTLAQSQNVEDLIVLTGDTHEFWANKLANDAGTPMGVELATSGVTSPGTGAFFGEAAPDYSRRLTAKNDDIVYHNLETHGYIDLSLGRDVGRADFIGISTVLSSEYEASTVASFNIEKTGKSLRLVENS